MSKTGYALGKMPEPQNGEEVKGRLRHSREVLRKDFGDLFGRTTFDFALEYIEMLESAQPKWISVEDELPPVGEKVLVCANNVRLMAFIDCEDVWHRDTITFRLPGAVTHWMPLPEPQKETENDCI